MSASSLVHMEKVETAEHFPLTGQIFEFRCCCCY